MSDSDNTPISATPSPDNIVLTQSTQPGVPVLSLSNLSRKKSEKSEKSQNSETSQNSQNKNNEPSKEKHYKLSLDDIDTTSTNTENSDNTDNKTQKRLNKIISQRRPSQLTQKKFGLLIRTLFTDKKIKEDGIPSEVIPKLYLGSIGAAKNIEWLEENNITHILCVANNIPPMAPDKFTYKNIEILDAPNVPIQDYFEETNEFIDNCIKNSEKQCKILVHCFAGMSRSVTVVSAYLMKTKRISAVNALKFVKMKREQANPNAGFIVQLIKYQKVLGIGYSAKKREENENNNNGLSLNIRHNSSIGSLDESKEQNVSRSSTPRLAAKVSINSKMLKSMDSGRRPSLLSALDKLRSLKEFHRKRDSINSLNSDNDNYISDSGLLSSNTTTPKYPRDHKKHSFDSYEHNIYNNDDFVMNNIRKNNNNNSNDELNHISLTIPLNQSSTESCDNGITISTSESNNNSTNDLSSPPVLDMIDRSSTRTPTPLATIEEDQVTPTKI